MFAVTAACTGSGDKPTTSPTTVATPHEAEPEGPVRGGTFTIALDGDPGALNPAVTTDELVHAAAEPMFNGLVRLGSRNEPSGDLAERWTIEQNGAVYRFTLREGVKWHDGRPFTSADVKFTFEKALIPFHSRARTTLGAANLRIEAPDPRTVVFSFPSPYAPLLQQLDVTEAPILPMHVYETCAELSSAVGCPPNRAPVGTGPFRFESYNATGIRTSRNLDYFRPDLPYLDALVEVFIPDDAARAQALEAKEVDWVWHADGPEASRLRGIEGIQVEEARRGPGGGYCVLTLAFNMNPAQGRLPFLLDRRVRQALWAGTDRQQIVSRLLAEHGAVSYHPIHSAIVAARALRPNLPVFDVDRARRLLDHAGWKDQGGGPRLARGIDGIPDGTAFRIDYHGFVGQEWDFGELLMEQWRAIGVDLQIKEREASPPGTTVVPGRQFDTLANRSCHETDPNVGVRGSYHSSQIAEPPFSNFAGYSDPEMDRLWDQSTAETDAALRYQLFQAIQNLAIRDLPYIWVAETSTTRAWNTDCEGINTFHNGLLAEAAYCRR